MCLLFQMFALAATGPSGPSRARFGKSPFSSHSQTSVTIRHPSTDGTPLKDMRAMHAIAIIGARAAAEHEASSFLFVREIHVLNILFDLFGYVWPFAKKRILLEPEATMLT